MKNILLLICILIGFNSLSQKKELSLTDAVLQQYRALAPEKMNGFSFIPNTDGFSYFKDHSSLYIFENYKNSDTVKIRVNYLNKILNTELTYFSGFKWENSTSFWVVSENNYFLFDYKMNKGELVFTLHEKSENIEVNTNASAVAYTINNNLFVKNRLGEENQITTETDLNIVSGKYISRNEFGISKGIFWSPNNKFIAFYQKDESGVHNYPLLDITSTPGELMSIKYPMAGQKSEKPKVGIYDVEKKRTVFFSPKGKVDDYITNLSWTPDNKFVVVAEVNRGQNHMWLNVYDAETGAFVRTLFDEQNSKWVEPENPAFFPNPKSNDFIWISQRDGFNNLYYYSWPDKKCTKLTSNKFVLKSIVGTINKNSEVVFLATGDSPLDMHYFAVNFKGKQRKITTESGTHTLKIGKDGQLFFDEYSSHSIPSKSLLLDGNGKEIKVLKIGSNKLTEFAIGNTEISSLKAKDGTKLYTRMIKPSTFDPSKKYPVLVYVYGGPHAQMIQNEWLDGSNLWMHWLAEKGYIIFTLDNRGSGNRGFEFESVIHRQLGTMEMEDQLVGVDYLKSLSFIDSNRLAIHGWSFGGFMTTSMMLRNPDVFKVGIAGGPVTDWKYYEIMYGERYMDLPEENKEGYEKASLLNYAQNLKGNLFLIHGTVDDVVVMQHNFALIKKFIEFGKQVDFFPYPMHQHNVYGKDRVHLIQNILNYVIEKNK